MFDPRVWFALTVVVLCPLSIMSVGGDPHFGAERVPWRES
jgi:hypothetical protein